MGEPRVHVTHRRNPDGTVTTRTTDTKNGVTESWSTRGIPDTENHIALSGILFSAHLE